MSERSSRNTEAAFRLICIIGACVCVVNGMRLVYMDFHMDLRPMNYMPTVMITVIPFVPIFAVAPRYKSGKAYAVIAVIEALVIATYPFIVVR